MPGAPRLQPVLCWRKTLAPDRIEGLLESLTGIDPARLIVSHTPPLRTAVVDYYPETPAIGRALLRNHGGRLLTLKPKTWWMPQEPRSEPLRIGRRLLVVAGPEQARYWSRRLPGRRLLHVPASLAFGTGEHATTEMMLRQIAAVPRWQDKSLLDIGTGTGILALAARALGCRNVSAFDFDPRAIEVARENDSLNGADGQAEILWSVDSVESFKPLPHDVVACNLFSELLVKNHRRILRALKPGGLLLLSGIFRDQPEAVIRTYEKAGMKPVSRHLKNRWCCLVMRKTRRPAKA